MANKPAPFISIEGCDGSGKSTQVRLLCEWLQGKGLQTYATREPGGTEGGNLIRALVVEGEDARWSARTETLLYMASRSDHIEKIIKPKTAEGIWVISDRFVDSTYAYQSYGRGIPMDEIQLVYDFFAKGFFPDMTVLLDIDADLGIHRTMTGKNRNAKETRFEKVSIDFHRKLRQGYLDLAKKDPKRYAVVLIDEHKTPEQIHVEVCEKVQEHFSL